ncbi:MAG TPA: hypothetical protein VF541_14250 [Longimicrobium sp.]|jgi:hypothetical protein
MPNRKKLSLEMDGLTVESFPTTAADAQPRGTVDAAEFTLKTDQCGSCGGYTCAGVSCFTSCDPGGPGCTCPIQG